MSTSRAGTSRRVGSPPEPTAPATGAPAVSVRNLSKTYRIARAGDRPATAAEAVLRRARHPLQRQSYDVMHALEDVTFDIPWGSAVGIVGRNGAGKSTLLKILTRITAPSGGRIELGGRVGSLLEIGTGFHPELTGRENIYLNGTLLGMRRKEIQRRFDEIVEFSGVEKFLETQVKRYSSGMYIRLAFAVAAHLETEILAIDEVLAVGDVEFQNKCIAKMRDVARDGRTVLYVSHQIQTVKALCSSAMYLEAGRLVEMGSVDRAIELYTSSFAQAAQQQLDAGRRPGTGELRFASAQPSKEVYRPDDDKVIEFAIPGSASSIGQYFVSAHVNNEDGVVIAQCDSRLVGRWFDPGEEVRGRLTLRAPWLKPGRYTVDLYLCKTGILDAWEGSCTFTVLPVLPYPDAASADGSEKGVVFGDFVYDS
ncbi:polysaccharide ABC transporter ATP-binding protein [Luteipulveratus sp. YIM 133132]|uniref:Polysaccharide ABC transporter ATP-binding protein n=1 Tax=Luteipulveratus flavus TaxID=3031728 RepID=A0ABT6CC64_9MICO|nr:MULTISPECIES: polysaccharide ABC transporter ATP-binding protein [unclassified Luteipulveratus]MDE9364301.1 polysaccharide ABC transporter ATP-binding protein [Luteipulveratus sp. YIM 133132]MDF8266495.1 polysaccharide ABC transporter ATP-binding protein [Luteipulveratus sp. YIM 133296]